MTRCNHYNALKAKSHFGNICVISVISLKAKWLHEITLKTLWGPVPYVSLILNPLGTPNGGLTRGPQLVSGVICRKALGPVHMHVTPLPAVALSDTACRLAALACALMCALMVCAAPWCAFLPHHPQFPNLVTLSQPSIFQGCHRSCASSVNRQHHPFTRS